MVRLVRHLTAAASRPSLRISVATRCWRDFRPPTSPLTSLAGELRSRPCSPISGSSPGIGSLYADEICFRAKLRPDRSGGSLTAPESASLAKSARAVLREAVRSRGSSLRDLRYRDLAGSFGSYQDRHAVYDRAGEPCQRCGNRIVRLKIGARSAYCCEGCQL